MAKINDGTHPTPLEDLPNCGTVYQGAQVQLAAGAAGLVAMIRFYKAGDSDHGLHTAALDIVRAQRLRDELNFVIAHALELMDQE